MVSNTARKRLFRAGTLAAAAATAVGFGSALTTSASAAGLRFTYHVTGTSTVAKPNSTVTLGPATLHVTIANNGTFTGSLPLPAAQTSFKVLGLVPVSASVAFVQQGKLTGRLTANAKGAIKVTSVAHDILRLSNVKIAGIPANVGSKCQTTPATLSVKSSGKFDLIKGGVLAGTFTIPKFSGCGLLNTPLINALVPGPGNTVSLHLTKGHAVG